MDTLHARLLEVRDGLSQISPLTKAIRYMLDHWSGLTRFIEDGRIEPDTNIVERPILSTPQQLFSWRREARRRAAESDAVSFTPVVVERREEAPVALASESRSVAARPHVIELDIDGASLWISRAISQRA